jgi:LysR family glycine cleavage system transcriptional activator
LAIGPAISGQINSCALFHMIATHRQLPQLQSLVYFESAARHLNFTAAAEELCTTQPAVSHRIRSMEEHLGVALFVRQHRGVKLTAEGTRLYHTVRESLAALRRTTEEVRIQESQRTLTVATDFGFAKFWLMPRIAELRRAIPGLQLRILTSQEEKSPGEDEVDVSIVFGNEPGDPDARLLFREKVVPVCSPGLLAYGVPRSPAELAGMPLLHLQQTRQTRWSNWPEWFAAQGIAYESAAANITFNDYSLVIQATQQGQGVALGWAPLVDALLERGDLMLACDQALHTERGYYLVATRSMHPDGLVSRLCAWILQQCRAPCDEARTAPVYFTPGHS